jgi:hypothetical protein
MRSDVRPKSNQLTAIGNSTHCFDAVDSWGVEATTAASTHAGHKESKEKPLSNHGGQFHNGILHKKLSLTVGLVDQLNFEFARNKNSMNVFTIRLRRVYRA